MAQTARLARRPVKAIAGIDGCPAGWICILQRFPDGSLEAHILESIAEIVVLTRRPDVVMLDIPIGLTASGPRECDVAARKLLGWPRSSSVFPAPIRPCLAARTYEEACAMRRRVEEKSMSRQAWGILGKIREVDSFLRSNPAWQARISEVHPELSFSLWNAGAPMAHRKKSAPGFVERERLVRARFGGTSRRFLDALPRKLVGRDDLMDAFAALWTAERVLRGTALRLPAVPPRDKRGLRMEILA